MVGEDQAHSAPDNYGINPSEVQGVILLHLQLGHFRGRVWFVIVTSLEVSVLLGMKFIEKFVAGIFPQEKYFRTEIEACGYSPQAPAIVSSYEYTRQFRPVRYEHP